MINLFKKNNKEIESLKEQISELQSRIKKQNQTIEELTGDRDYWKSQYEQLIENLDPNDAKLGEKIKIWVAQKMLHSIDSNLELQKLKNKLDCVSQEEVIEILGKAAEFKKESEILRELGDIILEIMNKD